MVSNVKCFYELKELKEAIHVKAGVDRFLKVTKVVNIAQKFYLMGLVR